MGRASQVGENGVEQVSTSGKLSKLVIHYIRTDSSDWIAAVLGLKNHPIMRKISGHGDQTKRKKDKK